MIKETRENFWNGLFLPVLLALAAMAGIFYIALHPAESRVEKSAAFSLKPGEETELFTIEIPSEGTHAFIYSVSWQSEAKQEIEFSFESSGNEMAELIVLGALRKIEQDSPTLLNDDVAIPGLFTGRLAAKESALKGEITASLVSDYFNGDLQFQASFMLAIIAVLALASCSAVRAWLFTHTIPDWLQKILVYTAAASILILLFDEIGLALEEWGIDAGIFSLTRYFIGLEFVPYFLYLANLVLIFPGAWATVDISGLLEKRKPDSAELQHLKHRTFLHSTLALAFTTLLTTIHIFSSNYHKLSNNYLSIQNTSLLIPSFIVILLCVLLLASSRRTEQKLANLINDNDLTSSSTRSVLLLLFITMSQTMVTKATLLLLVIPKTRNFLLRQLNRIRGSKHNSSGRELSLDDLGKRGLDHRIFSFGLIWLVTSAFPLVVLWQTHASPFPPANAGFLFSATVSLIYSLDILLLVWALLSRKLQRVKILFGLIFMVFSRYVTPTIWPFLYSAKPDYPSPSPFDFASSQVGLSYWTLSAGLLVLHLITAFALATSLSMTHADARYRREKSRDSFSRAARATVYVILVNIFLAGIGGSILPAVTSNVATNIGRELQPAFALIPTDHLVNAVGTLFGGIVLVSILGVIFVQLLLVVKNKFSFLRDSVKDAEGEDTIAGYGERYPWLKHWGWPHKGFKLRYDYLISGIIVLVLVSFTLSASPFNTAEAAPDLTNNIRTINSPIPDELWGVNIKDHQTIASWEVFKESNEGNRIYRVKRLSGQVTLAGMTIGQKAHELAAGIVMPEDKGAEIASEVVEFLKSNYADYVYEGSDWQDFFDQKEKAELIEPELVLHYREQDKSVYFMVTYLEQIHYLSLNTFTVFSNDGDQASVKTPGDAGEIQGDQITQ